MSNNVRSKKSSDDIIENITDLKSLFEDLKKESGLKGNNIRKKIELPFDEFLEQENPKKQSSNKKVNLGTQRGNSYDYNKMSEIKNEVEVIKKKKI